MLRKNHLILSMLVFTTLLPMQNQPSLQKTKGNQKKDFIISSKDLKLSLGYATIFGIASMYIDNPIFKNTLRFFSVAPFFAGLSMSEKTFNFFAEIPLLKNYFSAITTLKNLPGMGSVFACPDQKCTSICKKCRVQRMYQLLPLSLFSIDLMKKTMKTHNNDNDNNNPDKKPAPQEKEECAICLEEITNTNKQTLNCKHSFCKICITKWFRTKKNCPTCRANER